ncbi:TPA: hypothetical protein ACSP1Y_000142 [Aeromonas hydrophila]|uniref:hypothetical protein n=1 Tax=Aeromonas hydrophila TaxID=644 RepID=UPI0038D21403
MAVIKDNNIKIGEDTVPPTFYIGLTMAGAISAGAYSAGVMDFLLSALEEWEKQKRIDLENGGKTVPNHQVVISVMTGSSAGAVTAALTIPALSAGFVQEKDYTLKNLYRPWVEQLRFDPLKGQGLLAQNDLKGDGKVYSLLDSSSLQLIANEALKNAHTITPAKPYLADDLHLFFTHSNLRGIPYKILFNTVQHNLENKHNKDEINDGYNMMLHADRAHFTLKDAGNHPIQQGWADCEYAFPLKISDAASFSGHWPGYINAAILSGAFPIGLAAVDYNYQDSTSVKTRAWPMLSHPCNSWEEAKEQYKQIKPAIPDGIIPDFKYTGVDGGVLDNEPFQLARWSLMRTPGKPNTRNEDINTPLEARIKNGEIVDRAVIMIDPFPEPDIWSDWSPKDRLLTNVISKLFPMMKAQARCKMEEAFAAMDDSIYSRHLIAPIRDVNGKAHDYAIACGLLGGFGGFLSQNFRHHDYQLGRRNCQQFLRQHLSLPPHYAIVNNGYSKITPTQNTMDKLPLIPLVGALEKEIEIPAWPRVEIKDVEKCIDLAMARLTSIKTELLRSQNRFTAMAAGVFWWWKKDDVKDYMRFTLLSELVRRDQLTGWWDAEKMTEAQRLIYTELARPKYDVRTAKGIRESLKRRGIIERKLDGMGMNEKGITTILEQSNYIVKGPAVYDGRPSYVLSERYERPLFKWWDEWKKGKPTHDLD